MNWKKLLLKVGLTVMVLGFAAFSMFIINIENFSRPLVLAVFHALVCVLAVGFTALVCFILWVIWSVL